MDQELKKKLLNVAEDTVKVLISDFVKPELEKFIKASNNKYDDLLLAFIPQLEKALLEVADKIDGEVA